MCQLFKFLSDQYVEGFLDGQVLFRNLVYFKQVEDNVRRDPFEGTHVDAPNHDVEFTIMRTGQRVTGPFQFHNTIKCIDRIFCFCVSQSAKPEMFKFGNACVAIHNPVEFHKRINIALVARNRLTRLDWPFLVGRPVTYYDPAQPAPAEIDIKNARDLALVKQQKFADEDEFRFVFGRRGAYELKQMLVNELYSPAEELVGKISKEVFLKIGSIRDIARQQT